MRKLIYIFFLTASIGFLAGCLKSGTQTPGPAGPTGNTGAPGGDLQGLWIPYTLTPFTVHYGASPYSYARYTFPGYDSNYTYLLNVYVNRQNTKEWYKLPMFNYYQPGDELYASIGHDTIKIWYFNTGSGWPVDSQMNAEIVVIPQQNP
jgi:hypothetical protein